jgi:hypothetical protein
VAGPLLSPTGGGLLFSYFDSAGTVAADPAAPLARVALITVAARAQTKAPTRVLGANGVARRVDSLDAALYLHNRR